MRPKYLAILVAVTALMAIAAFFSVNRGGSAAAKDDESGPLLSELAAVVNDVAEVEIQKAGQTATLAKDGEAWVCRESSNYPADFTMVKELLISLSELEVVESRTRLAERHAELGLDEASGAAVVLRDAGGNTVASVVIGNTVYSRNEQRVNARLSDEDQTYLCKGDFSLSGDPSNWVDKEVLRLDSSRPEAITIEHADGETLSVSKPFPAAPNWTVAEVPEDRGLKSEASANSMGTALSYLSFDEVRPSSELAVGENHVATATFTTFDGLRFDVRVAKIDDQSWITIESSFLPPPAPVGPVVSPDPTDPEAPEAAPEPDPSLDPERLRALEQEAAGYANRYSGWAFRIPQYKADLFLKRLDDMLADPPEASVAPGDPGIDAPGATEPEDDAPVPTIELPSVDEEPAEVPAPIEELIDEPAEEEPVVEDEPIVDEPEAEEPVVEEPPIETPPVEKPTAGGR